MLVYEVAGDKPYPLAYGATLGQQHRQPLLELLLQHGQMYGKYDAVPAETVLLSFQGIESATASYLKALVLPLLGDLSEIEGFEAKFRQGTYVFPFVTNLTEELRHEFEVVLNAQNLVYLEAVGVKDSQPTAARLLGILDFALRKTIQMVIDERQCTASQLYEKYASEHITTTGWNNRLADLYERRLINRRKEGRQWVYTPLFAEVIYGNQGTNGTNEAGSAPTRASI